MEEIIYNAGDIKSKLELERIIKSEKNLKEIFSFLGRKKLFNLLFNLIIYNKHLQNIFKINIEEYKSLSGKYKIGNKDGIGKVYKLNTNILRFEGVYLNGKKNGKGKEYNNNGDLLFKGEYFYGERNGKGKEYYYNGELLFE